MLAGHNSRSKALTIIAAILLLCLAAHILYAESPTPRWRKTNGVPTSDRGASQSVHSSGRPKVNTGGPGLVAHDVLPCQGLPGAEDVVVVMRTGATEIQDKLPIHFETTFRCYKDFLIFSDYEEVFDGHPVHDVLAPINQGIRVNNPDFELHLRLQQYGRASLSEHELSGSASFEGGKGGKRDNAGWRLDKWKFLPMMNETLRLRPDKKWYVFVESDSYAVWSNILQWLATQDPARPLYAGSEVQIGPDQFAHGGSVFVMSRPAIEIGAKYYAEHADELDAFTAIHWAGDCVLGKMLLDAGVPLTWLWPMFQGGNPERQDFSERKGNLKLWCTAANSYHHFTASELRRMWQFEQNWIQSRFNEVTNVKRWPFRQEYSAILEHRDVFKNFVLPNITSASGESWDNLSPTLTQNTIGTNFDGCRTVCETTEGCLQFAARPDGCAISSKAVMLGEPASDVHSGWMLDRIAQWTDLLDDCKSEEGWVPT